MPSTPKPLVVLYGMLAGLLLAAATFIPLFCVAIPFILAAFGTAHGSRASIGATLFGFVLALWLIDTSSAITLLAFAPAGLFLPAAVKKKWTAYGCVVLAAALACAALVAMVYYFFPNGIGAPFAEYQNALLDQFTMLAQAGQITAEQVETLRLYSADTLEMIEIALPGSIICFSMLSSLIAYLICRRGARKRGFEIAAFPPFPQWRLPRGFGFGAVILILAELLLPQIYDSAALPYALEITVSVPLSVLGISVLAYFLERAKVPKAGRIVLAILATAFAGILLIFAGVFEQAFRLRQRMDNPPAA